MSDKHALIQKIWRIRIEYLRINVLRWECGAEPPPEMKDMRFDEAPEIVALFDEHGRETVLAAVREVAERFARGFEDIVNEQIGRTPERNA